MKNKNQLYASNPFKDVKKCGAYSRRTGKPCRQPAMTNGRCRMHGGKSTGVNGNKNALKHGFYTKEAIVHRKYIKYLIKNSKEIFEGV